MRNVYDKVNIGNTDKNNKRLYSIFALSVAIAVASCVLSVVFWEVLGRFPAQAIATIFTASAGVTGVYVFTVASHNKKVSDFIRKTQNAPLTDFCGTVTSVEKEITTSKGLAFHRFLASNGEKERYFYVPYYEKLPAIGEKVNIKANGAFVVLIDDKEACDE